MASDGEGSMNEFASPKMEHYFNSLTEGVKCAYEVAQTARSEDYDPEESVEITLASNLAERVIGLVSVVAPQIKGVGIEERIIALEGVYGKLDWRVAMIVALEIAQEKYCRFESKITAIETGIRVGFAYVTVGVVSAPLEGFTKLELKRRNDGKGEYFAIFYSGPIRNAGGTAAAVSVLIADYIRKHMGYAEYDPTEKEIKRCHAELEDYHTFITNLQYVPTPEESTYLMEHLPIEIEGDESEKYEVSNITLKDLPRVKANRLRNGYSLLHSSCIPLKAPKLWAKLEKWGAEMGMEQWSFLKGFVSLQKRMKAKGRSVGKSNKIKPDYTYISDIVAGRPVFGHPLRPGGWRLRYGRSRGSGYSGQAIHPASMQVLQGFLATGTQLKVERPGKAAAFTPCNTIDGPIVKLLDGSVKRLKSEEGAKNVKNKIKEIIYLGDVLINYGDFFDRAHPLVPAGYCPEWWIKEVEKSAMNLHAMLDIERLASLTKIEKERVQLLLKDPLRVTPNFSEAARIAKGTKTPLHPEHTLFWKLLSKEEFITLLHTLPKSKRLGDKLLMPFNGKEEESLKAKHALETLGVEHSVVEEEEILLEDEGVFQLLAPLKLFDLDDWEGVEKKTNEIEEIYIGSMKSSEGEDEEDEEREATTFKDILAFINTISPFRIRDKAGTFIGSRMGRPEKAKMRKMTGSPHVLFPVGDEGGRLRSFQAAMEKGKITSSFPVCYCPSCKRETVFFKCEVCGTKTIRLKHCQTCGNVEDCSHNPSSSSVRSIDIKQIFSSVLKKLGTTIYPDLIKGVRGTSNREHIPENLIKGVLRAKYNIFVNKDGTMRYDASEVTLTHFKPKEIRVGVEKLRELGYEEDIKGDPLINTKQVLELKPQDVILPCSKESPDEPADEVFFRATKFIDELLVKLYNKEPFFNLSSKEELVGQLIIGLAPHTSAGTLGRIIGFSQTQGFLAHPYFHAAMRRDCDGDESCFLLLMDAFLNFSKKYLPESRGSTMDAPLVLTSILNPSEVDDMVFHVDTPWSYPLEFYEAALKYKKPWEVSIPQIKDMLGTPAQFEGMGYTHPTKDINAGIHCSAYKTLPSMKEKLHGQMSLARKIRAVDESDVARLVIEKHFIRDTKGNLRKFSQQQYRCVNCNEKFRRPPLSGICSNCGGKIIFTISEGSVVKYLTPSISLANRFNVPTYLKQDLELTKRRVEAVFGKDAEIQEGLGKWFG